MLRDTERTDRTEAPKLFRIRSRLLPRVPGLGK
jgi:hypothetical protein